MKLIDFLKEQYKESSKRTLQQWIDYGRILVDGIVSKNARQEITKENRVTLSGKLKKPQGSLPEGIKIVFEDEHIVVIFKPAGLLSVAANYIEGVSAHAILKKYYKPERLFVVHRLDRETSGLMMFAKTHEAMEILKKDFKVHAVKREYRALVEGLMTEDVGVWRSYLYEDPNYKMHVTQDKKRGALAITHFKVIKREKDSTWLKIELETGRKNQIRVQAQDVGHPIVGDFKYGARINRTKRLELYAIGLEFIHPITKKNLSFRRDNHH